MNIEDFGNLTKTNQENALGYADCICGSLARAIKKRKETGKLASSYADSIGGDIRTIHNYFNQPVSMRAQRAIQEALGIEVKTVKYKDQKRINKKWKNHFGIPTGNISAGILKWEHYNGGIKELVSKLINLEETIEDPWELLKFISDNTFIIAKHTREEDHIDHDTSVEELKKWNNI